MHYYLIIDQIMYRIFNLKESKCYNLNWKLLKQKNYELWASENYSFLTNYSGFEKILI